MVYIAYREVGEAQFGFVRFITVVSRMYGNFCVHQMYQKTMMIMEKEKNFALFYFNCVLREDEVGEIFYSLHR
jgi:hypothetical protein